MYVFVCMCVGGKVGFRGACFCPLGLALYNQEWRRKVGRDRSSWTTHYRRHWGRRLFLALVKTVPHATGGIHSGDRGGLLWIPSRRDSGISFPSHQHVNSWVDVTSFGHFMPLESVSQLSVNLLALLVELEEQLGSSSIYSESQKDPEEQFTMLLSQATLYFHLAICGWQLHQKPNSTFWNWQTRISHQILCSHSHLQGLHTHSEETSHHTYDSTGISFRFCHSEIF